ncbi:hypothetical protein L2E82_45398 [Cichorium intybus]|uniref:Uncharacterized protein n=1 Tax=Cichorium intybus TaxID=13427 RepID=A0ACB8ZSW2_CICIN|nr:hypothetical protein L2E82_45398 [Cichorium intybus]
MIKNTNHTHHGYEEEHRPNSSQYSGVDGSSNKHIESGVSSEKSGDESDGVANKISKESMNLDFSKRTVKNMSLASESGIKSNGSSGRRHERDDGNNINFEEPKPIRGNNSRSNS